MGSSGPKKDGLRGLDDSDIAQLTPWETIKNFVELIITYFVELIQEERARWHTFQKGRVEDASGDSSFTSPSMAQSIFPVFGKPFLKNLKSEEAQSSLSQDPATSSSASPTSASPSSGATSIVETYGFCDHDWLKALGLLRLCPEKFNFDQLSVPVESKTVSPDELILLNQRSEQSQTADTSTKIVSPTIWTTQTKAIFKTKTERPTIWSTVTSTHLSTTTIDETKTLTATQTAHTTITATKTETEYSMTTTDGTLSRIETILDPSDTTKSVYAHTKTVMEAATTITNEGLDNDGPPPQMLSWARPISLRDRLVDSSGRYFGSLTDYPPSEIIIGLVIAVTLLMLLGHQLSCFFLGFGQDSDASPATDPQLLLGPSNDLGSGSDSGSLPSLNGSGDDSDTSSTTGSAKDSDDNGHNGSSSSDSNRDPSTVHDGGLKDDSRNNSHADDDDDRGEIRIGDRDANGDLLTDSLSEAQEMSRASLARKGALNRAEAELGQHGGRLVGQKAARNGRVLSSGGPFNEEDIIDSLNDEGEDNQSSSGTDQSTSRETGIYTRNDYERNLRPSSLASQRALGNDSDDIDSETIFRDDQSRRTSIAPTDRTREDGLHVVEQIGLDATKDPEDLYGPSTLPAPKNESPSDGTPSDNRANSSNSPNPTGVNEKPESRDLRISATPPNEHEDGDATNGISKQAADSVDSDILVEVAEEHDDDVDGLDYLFDTHGLPSLVPGDDSPGAEEDDGLNDPFDTREMPPLATEQEVHDETVVPLDSRVLNRPKLIATSSPISIDSGPSTSKETTTGEAKPQAADTPKYDQTIDSAANAQTPKEAPATSFHDTTSTVGGSRMQAAQREATLVSLNDQISTPAVDEAPPQGEPTSECDLSVQSPAAPHKPPKLIRRKSRNLFIQSRRSSAAFGIPQASPRLPPAPAPAPDSRRSPVISTLFQASEMVQSPSRISVTSTSGRFSTIVTYTSNDEPGNAARTDPGLAVGKADSPEPTATMGAANTGQRGKSMGEDTVDGAEEIQTFGGLAEELSEDEQGLPSTAIQTDSGNAALSTQTQDNGVEDETEYSNRLQETASLSKDEEVQDSQSPETTNPESRPEKKPSPSRIPVATSAVKSTGESHNKQQSPKKSKKRRSRQNEEEFESPKNSPA